MAANSDSLSAKIEEIIEPVIKDNFMEIVDMEVSAGKKGYLRLKIDKPGGVSIDDCSYMSRLIGEKLDEADIIKGKYSLEVSSPGMDRPLRKPADFERFIGKKAKVVTNEKIDNASVFIGEISAVSADAVEINTEKNEVSIQFGLIKKANLEIDVFK